MPQRVLLSLTKGTSKSVYIIFFILKGHFCPPCPSQQKARGAAAPPAPPVPASLRASQMMIPGRNVCPAGWTREYKGYLMAAYHRHYRTMYTCMDENPDYTRGTHASLDGALFYFVQGACGSLPCKPYIAGHELTCAVCTR